VLRRIETALAAMPDHDLRERSRTRHSVRWALERLAWRTATFRRAADALLRIAAVTPDLGSTRDATAHSWTDLFGTMLPTTATPPAERMEYLREVAASVDRRHRLLAVTAAGQILTPYEQTLVSAEAQRPGKMSSPTGRRRSTCSELSLGTPIPRSPGLR
jgi:hypothetical protein